MPLEDDVMLGVVDDRDDRSASELQVNTKRVAVSAQHPGLQDVVLRRWCTGIHEGIDDLIHGYVSDER